MHRNASGFKIILILSNGDCYKLHVSRVLEKLIVRHLDMKFRTVCGIWKVITMFTRVHHFSLSWDTSPSSVSLRLILLLSLYLHLVLPISLFPSRFSTKTHYAFLFSSMYATCPAHLIPCVLITLIVWWDIQITKPILMQTYRYQQYRVLLAFGSVLRITPVSETQKATHTQSV